MYFISFIFVYASLDQKSNVCCFLAKHFSVNIIVGSYEVRLLARLIHMNVKILKIRNKIAQLNKTGFTEAVKTELMLH